MKAYISKGLMVAAALALMAAAQPKAVMAAGASLDLSVYPVPVSRVIDGSDGNVTITVRVRDNSFADDEVFSSYSKESLVSVFVDRKQRSKAPNRLWSAGAQKAGYRQSGPLRAIASGLFEFNFELTTKDNIHPGDSIYVMYDGEIADRGVFANRKAIIQTDKSVYTTGDTMVVTLIEPDFNRNSQENDGPKYSLDMITLERNLNRPRVKTATLALDKFKASPWKETGKNSGIFQTTVKVPDFLYYGGHPWKFGGERVNLRYTDRSLGKSRGEWDYIRVNIMIVRPSEDR